MKQLRSSRIARALAAGGLLVALAVPAFSPTSATAATPLPAASEGPTIRTATFNVRCANCSIKSRTNKREKRWSQRREVVRAQILGEGVDVIGVQEASPGLLPGSSTGQFEDLVAALGAPYDVTNRNRYNCERSTTFNGCAFTDQGASQDSRIIYNTQRLHLEAQGSLSLDDRAVGNGSKRYMAWATFTIGTSSFVFATAHFEPGQSSGKIATRVRQVQAATSELERINTGNLPVIWGSDLASSKLTHAGNKSYDAFIAAGFSDPLGNSYKAKTLANSFVAGPVTNEKYFTLNNFAKAPKKYSNYPLGAHLDHILVKPRLNVTLWKQVINLKASGKFAGVIPSDHNMVRADVVLP
jgi:hypothetical protein